jgi:hypothetical protein
MPHSLLILSSLINLPNNIWQWVQITNSMQFSEASCYILLSVPSTFCCTLFWNTLRLLPSAHMRPAFTCT